MSNPLIKAVVRTLFTFTSRKKALKKCEHHLHQYLQLAQSLSNEAGTRCIEVPAMPGIDEDMRRWSFFMILEHNTIVNKSITATIVQLAQDQPLSGLATINPKKDVMPSASPDESQVDAFTNSVLAHLEAVKKLKQLRGTRRSPHPVFGEFDAHQWNCMFTFHLGLHLQQAAYVSEKAKKK
jgi:hypothetical protein